MTSKSWLSRTARGARVLASVTALALACGTASAETIKVGGAGSGLALVKALGERFHSEPGHAAVVVMPSLGSSGGIRAVVAGAIDVAVSGRPPKGDEAKSPLDTIRLGRTPVVFVSMANRGPIDIRAADLEPIFALTRTSWPDGRPIKVILRPKDELDLILLDRFRPGLDPLFEKARATRIIPVAQTDQDNLDLAQSVEGSLAVTALAGVLAERRAVTIASFDGVAPSIETLRAGRYPLQRPIYLVVRKDARPTIAAFVRFAVGTEGRALVETLGVLSGEG